MSFAHDTTAALGLAADIVNTEPGRASAAEGLPDVPALEKFLDGHRLVPRPAAGPADLDAVRDLRPRLFAVWAHAGQPGPLARMVNDLLEESDARPWLTDHDGGWHLHVTRPDAPVLHRVAAQIGFAFADLIRLGETERLRDCLAPGCQAVLVDLSRNRSRLYCDTGNCGNRQHVAAYRARQADRQATQPADTGRR
jgi:predicted RNA-binding Zn ribbon-like protein